MLDPAVRKRLSEHAQQMRAEGKLLLREKLDGYYAVFRSRFGPDRLAAMDGEPLLETMHAHGNKDSLVYWLEFKNDEEFPARFGSIAGGSALKFGVYRRAETGAWASKGEGSNPKDIPLAEAIEIARRHRDQLLSAVEAVSRVRVGA